MSVKKSIKEFVRRRNEMLDKRSVDALIEFVKSEPYYDDEFKNRFLNTRRGVQEFTLLSMIDAVNTLSFDTRMWAIKRRYELRNESAGQEE